MVCLWKEFCIFQETCVMVYDYLEDGEHSLIIGKYDPKVQEWKIDVSKLRIMISHVRMVVFRLRYHDNLYIRLLGPKQICEELRACRLHLELNAVFSLSVSKMTYFIRFVRKMNRWNNNLWDRNIVGMIRQFFR